MSTKEAFRAERMAWNSFCEAHANALGALYLLPDGTMWEIKGEEEYHAFVRDQARHLQHMVETLDYAQPLSPEPSNETEPDKTAAGQTMQEINATGAGEG